MRRLMIAISAGVLAACAAKPISTTMDSIAERYVKLVLRVGQHDKNFVDAYYGDPAWKPAGPPLTLTELGAEAEALKKLLRGLPPEADKDALGTLRRSYLDKQLGAVETRVAMLGGQKFSFDEEAERLYDANPPHKTDADFQPVLDELAKLLPGKGSVIERYGKFREKYVIPKDKVDAVFHAAIDGCRSKTLEHMKLPPGETFTVEYVTG